MTSLHEIIDRRFGVRTRDAENRETTAMVADPRLVLRADSTRLAALVVNLGQTEVFLRPKGVPSSTVGMLIGPNGGSMVLLVDEDFTLVGVEWFGLVAAGTSTLYIIEMLVEPDA